MGVEPEKTKWALACAVPSHSTIARPAPTSGVVSCRFGSAGPAPRPDRYDSTRPS